MFEKGKSGNPNGRPLKCKDFAELRQLAKTIANETWADTNGNPILFRGKKITIAEAILRDWVVSKDKRMKQAFMETAYGKVPDKLDVDFGDNPIKFVYERVEANKK